MTHRVVVGVQDSGTRLDQYLTRAIPDLSRAQIQRLIKQTHVTVDGHHAKPSQIVGEGQTVAVFVPPAAPATPQPEAMPLDVIYDDADIVVINKAVGVVMHPGAGHAQGTLVNALLHHVDGLSGVGGTERPGIVHRLDRGTSGVLVVAKHDRAHRHLAAQFQHRLVTKEYVALVWGTPTAQLVMNTAIGRDRVHRQRMSTRTTRGRTASTTILTVEPLHGVSVVRVRIGTGRTHQIRVHLSEAGFPIVGDALYGGARRPPHALAFLAKIHRPLLHSACLSIDHPADNRRMTFEADLETEFADVVQQLRSLAVT